MRRTRRFAPILAIAALVLAAVQLGSASAESSGPRMLSFKELEKGSTYTHISNTKSTPQANPQGDVFAFTNPLADTSGQVVGKLHIACTTTTGAKNFLKSVLTCTGVLVLRDGTLTIQANSSPGVPTTTGAITGGTGAYANSIGVFVSKETKSGSLDTFTLAS